MLNTSFKFNSRESSQFSSIHNYVLVGKFLVFDFNQSTCIALVFLNHHHYHHQGCTIVVPSGSSHLTFALG